MAPPAATLPQPAAADEAIFFSKLSKTNGTSNGTHVDKNEYDVLENYEGKYRFAPIEEAQVSRAMIKRYSHVQSQQ